MSILSNAGGSSAWRGYEYYIDKKVLSFKQTGDDEYAGKVAGSASSVYDVVIDTAHIRRSKCNCPHANGKRIICKHMVALFFSAFPQEAYQYIKEVEKYEEEEDARFAARCAEIEEYVHSLSTEELKTALFNALMEAEENGGHRW